jgi:methionyl-tRNA formyltransferase
MRIAIIGQQDFGKAVLEAFLGRGDTVAGVFCAPEKPGARPDPLRIAAEHANVRVHQLSSLKTTEAREALRSLDVDLGVMAYVLQFVPQDLVTIPRHGMIQYHPSLLPRYRGPSAINWPIIRGDVLTGLTIFRPVDGLDEGPVLLQKSTPIDAEDTLGSVYFERLFPLGVAALVEAAELVTAGRAAAVAQDESQASYEGWCRGAEARISWHNHVDLVHNLIRGCDPSPGAWTVFNGKKLQLFETRKHAYRKFSDVQGSIGAVSALGERSVFISAHGGRIEVFKLRYEGGQKIAAPQFCADAGLGLGTVLGE